MSLVFNQDRSAYGRWLNFVLSLFLPGSAHFLSGRKRAGVIWFCIDMIFLVLMAALLASPIHLAVSFQAAQFVGCGLLVITAFDSCRKPIPKLKFTVWVVYLALVAGLTLLPYLIRQIFLQPFVIPTSAMAPTLRGRGMDTNGQAFAGDHVFVDKWSYRVRSPKRGEVIVFKTDGIEESAREKFAIPQNAFYVKRLVGLPGERVSIHSPYVYINGQKLLEPKIFESISSQTNGFPGFLGVEPVGAGTNSEIQLAADEYFVLGDNSTNSLDSRYFGPIKNESIIGKAAWIYWPPERRHSVE